MRLTCRTAFLDYRKRVSDINQHETKAAPVISKASTVEHSAAATLATRDGCEQRGRRIEFACGLFKLGLVFHNSVSISLGHRFGSLDSGDATLRQLVLFSRPV